MAKGAYDLAIEGEQNAFVAWKLFRRGLALLGWLFLGIAFFMVDGVGILSSVFKTAKRAKRIKKIRKKKEKNL